MKTLACIFLCTVALNAAVLKQSQLDIAQEQKNKSLLESQLLKEGLISPLNITGDITKDKKAGTSTTTTSKKLYLDINQDIFRSGGIFYTIQKANQQKALAHTTYENSLATQNYEVAKRVLGIQKLDLQIAKQEFLVRNKQLEIDKKQEEYINGTTDIESLDTAIIEKNDLVNQSIDLKLSKTTYEKELKEYTNLPYNQITLEQLQIVPLESFLQENKELIIQNLNSTIAKTDEKITTSSYLPKVSIFSQIGLEDSDENQDDDFYNYGLRITMPLDFRMGKAKEVSKLSYKLAKLNQSIKEESEKESYLSSIKSLKSLDDKLINAKSTIDKYQSIYELTTHLVDSLIKTKQDLQTIQNRLKSSRLDLDILNIDKQLIIYEINRFHKKF